MRLKTLAATVLALALCVSPVQARTHHPQRCKPGYHRVKRHHRVRCVKRKATVKPTARPVKLHAHLDPAYTRDPLNPFRVSYEYSAAATQAPVNYTAGAMPTVEEPAPLPEGILALYSDGSLECAMSVGGPTSGGECPVTYAKLGEHRVTTIYTSGSVSATETSVEHIEPLATSLTISTTYEELEGVSTTPNEWHEIGTYTVNIVASPSKVNVELGCGEAATEPYGVVTANGCYLLNGHATVSAHVYARGLCSIEDLRVMKEGPPRSTEPNHEWPTVEQIESGTYHLRASTPSGSMGGNEGYAASEATTPLQVNPAWRPACY